MTDKINNIKNKLEHMLMYDALEPLFEDDCDRELIKETIKLLREIENG